jgi:hypothetical protein
MKAEQQFSAVFREVPRNNIAAVILRMAGEYPGRVLGLEMRHEDDCPCVASRGDVTDCDCDAVDLVFTEIAI